MEINLKEIDRKVRKIEEQQSKNLEDPGRFLTKVALVCEKLCMALILVLLFVVVLQIVLRSVLNVGISWVEEVCLYGIVWLGMIGSVILVIEQGHVRITFLFDRFGKKARLVANFAFNILACFFLGIFARYGWLFTLNGKKVKSPSLPISKFFPNFAIPVGSVLMIGALVVLMVKEVIAFSRLVKESKGGKNK